MQFEMTDITARIIFSLGLLLVGLLASVVLGRGVSRFEQRHGMKRHRGILILKLGKFTIGITVVLGIFIVWGLSIENFWIFLSGILGLIAIGFFAVWSLLSNIVAGILLYFVNPFRIGEWVRLAPDEIVGQVTDITLFYTQLQDADGQRIEVPNNLFFQKYVVVSSSPPLPPEAKETSVEGK